MKNWKYLMLALAVTMIVGTAASASAFEARGSAVVTGMQARDSTWDDISNIYVTNITGSDVSCRITVYDHNGNDVTSLCKVYTGASAGGGMVLVSSGTGTLDLPASNSRSIQFSKSGAAGIIIGHAVIEWSSEDTKLRKALIANMWKIQASGDKTYGSMVTINGGQSF
ncbi:MAG: hypothetical protein OCC46_17045 [Pseudodesulfovibrio sp.]